MISEIVSKTMKISTIIDETKLVFLSASPCFHDMNSVFGSVYVCNQSNCLYCMKKHSPELLRFARCRIIIHHIKPSVNDSHRRSSD